MRLTLKMDLRDSIVEGKGFGDVLEDSEDDEDTHGGPTGFAIPPRPEGVSNLPRGESRWSQFGK